MKKLKIEKSKKNEWSSRSYDQPVICTDPSFNIMPYCIVLGAKDTYRP